MQRLFRPLTIVAAILLMAAACRCSRHSHHNHPRRQWKIRLRMLHAELPRLQAIETMVAKDEDCTEVLTQVVSARGALKSFGDAIIHSHLHACLDGPEAQTESRRKLHAFLTVLERCVA
jgi:DNA-binding FrmR family transcriptional regulator